MLRAVLLGLLQPIRVLLFAYFRLRSLHKPFLLKIALRGDYSEAPLTHGLWSFLKPSRDRFYLLCLDLHSVIVAAKAKRIKLRHLALTIESHNLGWAQAWELRHLLKQATESGISTSCWLLNHDRISLYIATGCEQIYATDGAVFDLSPFTNESVFMLSLLNKLGIKPQFISVGDFKSAAEVFTRNSMSPAARKQTEELIGDIETEFLRALCERSKDFKAKDRPLLLTAEAAKDLKLIQGICSAAEYSAWLKEKIPTQRDLARTLRLLRAQSFRLFAFRRLRRVALIVAEGIILDSTRPRPGSINWHDYAMLSEELSRERYDAVLIRINSPGGSALVSQLLWREWMLAAERLKSRPLEEAEPTKEITGSEKKSVKEKTPLPVFVSQGNVAASGGYYLSAAGERIFTTPLSITGSIGVVGGKFNIAPLLAKWGVSVDRAPKKNPAPLFSAFANFDTQQRKTLEQNMHEIYTQFLRDTALGRNVSVDKLKPHAAGRVFSGGRACTIGLADEKGGISDALSAIRGKLGIKPLTPVELTVLPAVHESLFAGSALPLGASRLLALADFALPGIYALDPRWVSVF